MIILSYKSRVLLVPRYHYSLRRTIYSVSRLWPIDENNDGYVDGIRKSVESYWRRAVTERRFSRENAEKFYCLSMFPYPSGALHMGHVRVYALSNLFGQFFHMKGYSVIHPIGWDSFGLPAENAAKHKGVDPEVWTKQNILSMKSQLERLDLSFDWEIEVTTSEPSYYKWTQWLFLRLYEAGLAYRTHAYVNWDPIDKTVLANEQVDDEGKSWRSGAQVEKRLLPQWCFRTMEYSKDLQKGIKFLDKWPKYVKTTQKNWIGPYLGLLIQLPCFRIDGSQISEDVGIFICCEEDLKHLIGVKVMKGNQNYDGLRKQEPVFLKNPMNGKLLPLTFSEEIDVVSNSATRLILSESAPKSSMKSSSQDLDSKYRALTKFAEDNSIKGVVTCNNIRDWLVSRQRFWGTPIPIVHCNTCGTVAVEYSDLPVRLPRSQSGRSTLADYPEFVNTTCPQCGEAARRETDTMDTFVDSAWYFLRYLDPNNDKQPFDLTKEKSQMPVDLYIGGVEHARLHLLYARFFMRVLHDLGLASNEEPFSNLLCQGILLSKSYKIADSVNYVPMKEVSGASDDCLIHEPTGKPVVSQIEKMSKSKFNGVDPDDLIKQFGSDTVKCYVLDNINPAKNIIYNPDNIAGVQRWKHRLWLLVTNYMNQRVHNKLSEKYVRSSKPVDWEKIQKQHLKTIASFKNMDCTVSAELRPDKCLRELQALTQSLKTVPPEEFSRQDYQGYLLDLIIMVSPFMPLICLEMWSAMSNNVDVNHACYQLDKTVLDQKWPELSDRYPEFVQKSHNK